MRAVVPRLARSLPQVGDLDAGREPPPEDPWSPAEHEQVPVILANIARWDKILHRLKNTKFETPIKAIFLQEHNLKNPAEAKKLVSTQASTPQSKAPERRLKHNKTAYKCPPLIGGGGVLKGGGVFHSSLATLPNLYATASP